MEIRLLHGNSVELLKEIPDKSVDAVVTDPPYAAIRRDYGWITEEEWHKLMDAVVQQVRRVLKPTGSAVFILQPNMERIGRMRPWLWEFMAKYSKEWGIVQDCYWWNYTMMPTTHCARHNGLLRCSVKTCVWLGPEDCYRNQDEILWEQSESNKAHKLSDRALKKYPSGAMMREGRCIETANERGGSTPFNLLPISSGSGKRKGSVHGAATPLTLCEWWVRYICPKGGTVLDPFSGTATVGLAAFQNGRNYIGIEQMKEYHEEAVRVVAEAQQKAGDTIL